MPLPKFGPGVQISSKMYAGAQASPKTPILWVVMQKSEGKIFGSFLAHFSYFVDKPGSPALPRGTGSLRHFATLFAFDF